MSNGGNRARRRRSIKRAQLRAAQSLSKAPSQDEPSETLTALDRRRELRVAHQDQLAAQGGSFPLGERAEAWDSAAAVKGYTLPADGNHFMWRDPDKPADEIGSYKLPFVDGDHAVWKAITAIAAALQGGRGGVAIPEADMAGVKTKVAGYYAKARDKYDDDSIKAPWEASSKAAIDYAVEHELPVVGPHNDTFDITQLTEQQKVALSEVAWKATIDALAYAELGPVDEAILAVAAAGWADAFADTTVVWDPEDGVMDLMDDLREILNPSGSWSWYVADVKTDLSAVILCDFDGDDAFMAPITIGADREPVLSPKSEWTAIESAWVKDTDEYIRALAARTAFANGVCAACGHEFSMHSGDGCSMDQCSCDGYVAADTPDEDKPTPAAVEGAEEFTYAACADCEHAYGEHLGTKGPCTVDGCDCMSYDQPDSDQEDSSSAEGVSTLQLVVDPSLVTNAVASAMRGMFVFTGPGEPVLMADGEVVIEAPAARAPGDTSPVEWSAIFAPEGKLTSDGRAFAPGAISWRELPLTLMAMIETSEGGHIGAEIAGRIDAIWRDEAAGLIRAKGVFDSGEYGAMIAGLVEDQTLRGVSVDLAINRYETGPKGDWFDDQGNWAPKETAAQEDPETPDLLDLYSDDIIAVILDAEIGMTTVCPFPAFAEAKIAMGDSLVAGANPSFWTLTHAASFTTVRHGPPPTRSEATGATETPAEAEPVLAAGDDDCGCHDVLTASAAGLVPNQPPADWFADPQLDEPTAITITEDGRIYGHAAAWGVCHIGLPGSCRTAPHSNTDYRYFHLGEVLTEDGGRVACGQITLDTGHADRSLGSQAATAHYDDTGTVVAHVQCGEDEHGIWVAGALQPDAPEEKVRLLTGSKLSGDWRKIDGNLELVALLAVNVPGFPVPRAKALVASIDGEEAEVMTLVAAGIPVFQAELSEDDLARFKALELHADFTALVDQAD